MCNGNSSNHIPLPNSRSPAMAAEEQEETPSQPDQASGHQPFPSPKQESAR